MYSPGCIMKKTLSWAGSSDPLSCGPKTEQMVTPMVMKTTATKDVFVGVSRTPQHPTVENKNVMTIVRPAKGAISASGVMAKTITSRPAACGRGCDEAVVPG